VRLGAGVVLGRGVRFDVARGGVVELGDRAVIGERCRFHVAARAVVRVGAGAVLGERCAVVAQVGVEVGERALLADEVVLVDAGARFEDVETPVRLQGLDASPVVLGAGVRVGPGAVVGPGVTVGAGAAVGAHAVVEANVAPGAVVDGVPARAPVAPRADARGPARVPRDH
jgi:acetyltransferase-like isoleucine patch superfamily enzyme